MKKIIVILLSLMPLLMFAKGDKDARVIIITIDGLRWQEVFSGAEENLISDTKQIAATIASALGITFTPDDGAQLEPIR